MKKGKLLFHFLFFDVCGRHGLAKFTQRTLSRCLQNSVAIGVRGLWGSRTNAEAPADLTGRGNVRAVAVRSTS